MLNDLVLHERTRMLAEKLISNLPHALIIDGPVGTGVLALAKALSHSTGSPEMILQPKKSQNGQMVVDEKEGSIIIEDIRQLYEQTRTRQPQTHVYILDTGERSMTIAAQNAFLKLLEEPRPNLHFIITTHQFDQLLPTIRSRSQRLALLPVSSEQTMDIISGLNISDATTRTRLAFVGRGRPALIKRLAADKTAYDARVQIMSDAKTMIGGTKYEKLVIAHKYRDNRANAVTLLDDINHQLRTLIQTRPDQALVRDIATHLETRQKILSGGNIRLQLAADMV